MLATCPCKEMEKFTKNRVARFRFRGAQTLLLAVHRSRNSDQSRQITDEFIQDFWSRVYVEPRCNREDVRSNDSESIVGPRIYRLSRVEKFRYSRRSKKIKGRSLGDAIQIYASVFHRCEVFMVMSLPLGTRTRA